MTDCQLREMREIFRRQGVRKKILDNLVARPTAPPQAQVRPPVIPQVPVQAPPTFGLPMPKRRKVADPAQAGPSTSTSTSTSTWAQPNLVQSSSASPSINLPTGRGSRTPTNRPGGTQADAIAIDDDDEDEVRDSVPPPVPTSSSAAPAASISAPAANAAFSNSAVKCATCGIPGHTHEACPILTADVAVLKRYVIHIILYSTLMRETQLTL